MAEEVEIGNVGGDGVASEVTLARLAATMELMAKKKGINPEDVNKKLKELSNATTDNTKSVEDGTTARTDNTKKLKKSTAALSKFGNTVGSGLISALTAVGQSAVNIGEAFASGTDRLDAFASQVPLVGRYLGPLASLFDDSFEAFQSVASSGAAFNNSLTQMRSAAAEARMPLQEFTGMISANSDKLAQFGGTATGGALQIVKLNKALGSQREELLNMGLSYQDINEALIDYQYLQRAGNRGLKLSQQQQVNQADAAARYTKNLVTLGKLTGEDVKSQQAKIAQAQMDVAMQAKLAGLSAEEREKMDTLMANTLASGGEQAVEALKREFLGMPPLTQEAALFTTQFGEQVTAIKNGLADVYDSNVDGAQMQAKGVDYMMDMINGASATFARLEPGMSAAAAGLDGPMAEVAAQLQSAGIKFTDFINRDTGEVDQVRLRAALETAVAEGKNRDATTNSIVQTREALAETRKAFETSVISPLMESVAPALQELTGYLNELANSEEFKDAMSEIGTMFKEFKPKVEAFVKAFKEDPMKTLKGLAGDLLSGVGSMIGDALVSVITSPKVIAAMVGGVALLWGAKAVTNKLGSVLGSVFGGGAPGTSGVSPKGGQSKGGGTAGKVGGGIGNFVGQMGAGVMKGAAAGLAAFGGPQSAAIALGAVTLGAAITAIGAGIAGATWLMGSALPKFAEGMDAFKDIDGDNLLSVAKGIGAVGVSIAAMGAGSAIGSFGNTISNVLDALPGKSPLEKIQDFSKIKLNKEQIESNSQAIMAYSNAMKGFDGGPGADVFGALKAGLVSFLGGETDPIEPIKRFGATDIDPNGLVVKNAKAVKAYADAMKGFDGGPKASVFGAVKAGLVEFLGGDSDPMTPLIKFGATDLDPNGLVVKNATAVKAYSDAMKGFSTPPAVGILGTLRAGLVDFLGGNSDPLTPLIKFGKTDIDPNGLVVKNAAAVKAYADAMKDFPTDLPKGDAFAGLKAGLISFMGGEDAFEPLRKFGAENLNAGGFIISNGEAIKSFAAAMKDFPTELPSGDALAGFKNFASGLLGGEGAFEPIKKFGQEKFDGPSIIANAAILSEFSTAMSAFSSSGISSIEIPKTLASRLEDLNNVPTGNLNLLASGMTAIANVSGLQSNLDILNSGLDTSNVTSYTTAMESLVQVLSELNEELGKDNKAGFGKGTNAGDVVSKMDTIGSGGGAGSDQLNTIMNKVLLTLEEMRDLDIKVEKNTADMSGGFNIAARRVSRGG